MEEHEAMVLLSLKHQILDWLRRGEAFVEVIDSLLPTNRGPHMTYEQMIDGMDEMLGLKKGD